MQILLVIQKEAGSDYGVIIPAVEGCYSAGSTIDEATSNAKEAIQSHLEVSKEEGFDITINQVDYDAIRKLYPSDDLIYIEVDEPLAT